MKIISINHARAIWLAPTNEFNPRGKFLLPMFPALVERYRFQIAPTFAEAIKEQKGFKFQAGLFNSPRVGPIAIDFSIFNDGLVADTRNSTSESEAFLEEVINWGADNFGLVHPSGMRKQCFSSINFMNEKPLQTVNSKFAGLIRKLEEKLPGQSGLKFELSGLAFGSHNHGGRTQPVFKIERVESSLPDENRYFSVAPLSTDDHIEVIKDFLAILKTK